MKVIGLNNIEINVNVGDKIRFHNWGLGGFDEGIIIPFYNQIFKKDDFAVECSPKRHYFLSDINGVTKLD